MSVCRRLSCCLSLLALIALSGCSDDTTAATADAGVDAVVADLASDGASPDQRPPDAGPDWTAPFDPVVCGAKPYTWLPPHTMGAVVSSQRSMVYSLPKSLLETLLDNSGYGGVVTPKYDVNVYLVRYETQDRGKKVEATMAMGYPTLAAGEAPDKPSLLWLHGTTGFNDACAPTASGAEATLVAALMASQGYVTAAPDYIGLAGFGDPSTAKHAYLVGEQVALGSLDALRAAKKVLEAEKAAVRPDGRLVVWGGSQGGHAALFASLYAPYYLPREKVAATVALVPPMSLLRQTKAAMDSFNKGTVAGAAVMIGQSRWYGMEAKLPTILTDTPPNNIASDLPTLMDTKCSIGTSSYDVDSVDDVFTTAAINAISTTGDWTGFEDWRCILAANSLPDSPVKPKENPPTLVVVSELDTLVNSSAQRPSFDALCAAGYQAEYIECRGAKHTQGAVWSLPEQFAWVEDRLANKPMKKVCQRSVAVCCSASTKGPCATP